MNFIQVYSLISVILAAQVLFTGKNCFFRAGKAGTLFGVTCVFACGTNLAYLASALSSELRTFSVFSSIYFLCIDYMLLSLLAFSMAYADRKMTRPGRGMLLFFGVCVLLDTVALGINPVKNIAVEYLPQLTPVMQFRYTTESMHVLYYLHLVYTYAMVAAVLGVFLFRLFRVPREYRRQYYYIIFSILLIVAVNATFLYLPGEEIWHLLDYSVLAYSIAVMIIYWTCFSYSHRGMLQNIKAEVFDSLEQGIVMFDYRDMLVLANHRAKSFLGKRILQQDLPLSMFLFACGFEETDPSRLVGQTMKYYVPKDGNQKPLRCDIHELRTTGRSRSGMLFVFTDLATETDLVTGFQSWESFCSFAAEKSGVFAYPVTVCVCDIDRLSVFNAKRGHDAGDQLLHRFAEELHRSFPEGSYGVRGRDAHLVMLNYRSGETETLQILRSLQQSSQIDFKYSVAVADEEHPDLLQAIERAEEGLGYQKLLDETTVHSSMLTSLIRALEECDSDTEAHVRRTRRMGDRLAERIGLTNVETSTLGLLSVLHDIGKIGVPLEILNKPGKLTDAEWEIMKSHVDKGYQIARSTPELSGIADMVRSHHERWDGHGYPDGLQGEEIPLLSRVISVVDSFDAMVSDRPYRKGMPVADAVKELQRCSGSQFDPNITEEFIQLLLEQYLDEMTREKTAAAEKAEKEKRMEAEFPSSGYLHPVRYSRYILDENHRIVQADERFSELTGYTERDIAAGLSQLDMILPEERGGYFSLTEKMLTRRQMAYFEHRLLRKDGTVAYVFCMGRLFFDSAVRNNRSEVIIADAGSMHYLQLLAALTPDARGEYRGVQRSQQSGEGAGFVKYEELRSRILMALSESNSGVLLLRFRMDNYREMCKNGQSAQAQKSFAGIASVILGALRREDAACLMEDGELAAAMFYPVNTEDTILLDRARQIYERVNLMLQTEDTGESVSLGCAAAREELRSFERLQEASEAALSRATENGRGRFAAFRDEI